MVFKNGEVQSYEGEFMEGLPNGNGEQYFTNGLYAMGEFVNGLVSGKARANWPDGRVFEGQW